MPKTPRQLYIAKLDEIAARYGNMEDVTSRAIVNELQDTRRKISDLLIMDQTEFTTYRLRSIQAEIDAVLSEFDDTVRSEIADAVRQAYEDGGMAAAQPLAAIGVPGSFFKPSATQLNILIDFSAELVTGITNDMRQAINQELRNATLGLQSQYDAMRNLTDKFGVSQVKQGKKVASGISAKAETVVRTELQRVFNLSEHSQQLELQQSVQGLLKRWVATVDSRTRKGHLKAHNDYRKEPIPVGEPFIVYNIDDNWKSKGKTELMYPADPRGPGWATINCRCRMATIHPAVGVVGGPLDGSIASMVGDN